MNNFDQPKPTKEQINEDATECAKKLEESQKETKPTVSPFESPEGTKLRLGMKIR